MCCTSIGGVSFEAMSNILITGGSGFIGNPVYIQWLYQFET